jgi:tetratricopeptide (TPR) repeat protein
MGAGPLRSLAVVPKPPEAPVVAPGKTPDVVLPTQTEIAPDSSKVLAEYQRLYSAKQVAKATNLLREAIDSMPLDAKLRVAFVQHLNSIGRHDEAAAEAQRALVLLPESPELRALAARTYINSGQSDLAEAQLNEALARNPDDPLTRTMVADLNLRALKPRAAIEHIDAAFKKTPTKDLAYRRATANALLGNGAAVEADLAQAAKLESTSEIETYRLCMHVVDNGLDKRMGDLRSLFQRATVKRQDPEVAQLLDSQISLLQTHQKLLQGWPAPGIHKNSHGKRLLALNLLAQSLSGLKAFLSDGNEDTLSDSSIDLGETIKQFGLAKQALSMEEGSIAEHGSITVHPDY